MAKIRQVPIAKPLKAIPVEAPKGKKKKETFKIIFPKIELEYVAQDDNITFDDVAWYIHGIFHIGKTSLFTCFKDIYFISLDRPNKSLKYRKNFTSTYEGVLGVTDSLITAIDAGKIKVKHVVFDNTRLYAKMVNNFTCRQFGLERLGGNDLYGSDWAANSTNVVTPIMGLIEKGVTVHGIAHTAIRDVNTVEGKMKNVEIPDGGSQGNTVFCEQTDITGRYTYDDLGNRVLTIEGTNNLEAANKIKNHFLYTNGERMKEIPLGRDENEAYDNLVKAFENGFQQTKRVLKTK